MSKNFYNHSQALTSVTKWFNFKADMADRYLGGTSAPRKSVYIIEDVAARLQAIKDEHQPKEIIFDKKVGAKPGL